MSTLDPVDDGLDLDLDLDTARSAAIEVTGQPGVKIGGQRLPLPAELPLDVLDPLASLDVDVSLLLRQALDARKTAAEAGDSENEAMIDALVTMFAYNPNLPKDLVACGKLMVLRLFGDDGYAHLVACRLTAAEMVKVGRYVMRRYGVGLGESSQSSDSSEGTGTTSNATSSASTTSTSAVSGSAPALAGS